jgi:hypothetical protein
MNDRQIFVSEIRQRIVETGVFAEPDPAFSLQVRPHGAEQFKSKLWGKLTFAIYAFAKYRAAVESWRRIQPSGTEKLQKPEDLLEIVKDTIEMEFAQVMRLPVDGLFDRREAVAEVVQTVERDASWLSEPDSEQRRPRKQLDSRDLRQFACWIGATVDAVFAEEEERMDLGIPESWTTRPVGGAERGTY